MFTPKLTEEKYRVMLQFQYILMKAREEGCRMIYANEFAVLGEENTNYSWAPVNTSSMVSVNKRERTFHCCIAMSEEKAEGLRIQNQPFTADDF